jgi:hypothetical protein
MANEAIKLFFKNIKHTLSTVRGVRSPPLQYINAI